MRFFLFSVLIITGLSHSAIAKYIYDYNGNCKDAYIAYANLDLEAGTNAIRQEIVRNPYNLMATYVADYDDCLLLLLNGDKRDLEQRKSHQQERLDILERGDENSPWQRLCRAGVYMHWAFIYMRFEENMKAASAFRKSFLLLKENKRLYPSFEYNDVLYGLEETLIGTIPDDYKWIASVFGLKGSVKEGVARVEKFVNTHNDSDPFYNEALIYYLYLKFYLLSKQEDVWNFINIGRFPVKDRLLNTFVKSNIALNYRQANVAIKTLQLAAADKNYSRFPIFDYQMGSALYYKLDPSCETSLKSFIKRYNGKMFVKDAWHRLAISHYLHNDPRQADYCRRLIPKQGNTLADIDKRAQRFAKESSWPNKTLLQARLLIDGGFYDDAYARIGNTNESTYQDPADKVEYYFRMGRIYDEMGNDAKALQLYRTAILRGKNRTEYFAARSALQMAFIYEKAGKREEALASFKECLAMRNHDFQNSIDQQAKAGVNRLSL